MSWDFPLLLPWGEYNKTLLMISWQWAWQRAWHWQTITRTYNDWDPQLWVNHDQFCWGDRFLRGPRFLRNFHVRIHVIKKQFSNLYSELLAAQMSCWKINWAWIFLPEASFGLWVLLLLASCVSVCPCVCVCASIIYLLVRPITWDPFKLGSPNLDQRCKTPRSRPLLFWGAIDLDLQGQI